MTQGTELGRGHAQGGGRAGQRLYDWRLISRNGGPVASSGGIEVMTQAAIADVDRIPDLFVVAGLDAQTFDDRAILSWPRRLELRLDRARGLLTQTAMSALDVALACGFVSASHFSKCYRELFGKTPREERAPPR